MQKNPKKIMQILRKNVSSKGGTTEAGCKVFDEKKFEDIFRKSFYAAIDKANELGKIMNSAILLIIQVIFGFLATIFTLRFYMQLCNVSTSHDLVQMIIRLTNTFVVIFSKVIPRYKNIELSSIIIAIFLNLYLFI